MTGSMIHQHARAYPHKRQTYIFACIRELFWTGNNRSCDCKHFYTLAAFSKRYRKDSGNKINKKCVSFESIRAHLCITRQSAIPFFPQFLFPLLSSPPSLFYANKNFSTLLPPSFNLWEHWWSHHRTITEDSYTIGFQTSRMLAIHSRTKRLGW